MLLLIAVCAVIVMASVIDDHSAVNKTNQAYSTKRILLYRNPAE